MAKHNTETPVWIEKLKIVLSYLIQPILWLRDLIASHTRKDGAEKDHADADKLRKELDVKKKIENRGNTHAEELKTILRNTISKDKSGELSKFVGEKNIKHLKIKPIAQAQSNQDRKYELTIRLNGTEGKAKDYKFYLDDKMKMSADPMNKQSPIMVIKFVDTLLNNLAKENDKDKEEPAAQDDNKEKNGTYNQNYNRPNKQPDQYNEKKGQQPPNNDKKPEGEKKEAPNPGKQQKEKNQFVYECKGETISVEKSADHKGVLVIDKPWQETINTDKDFNNTLNALGAANLIYYPEYIDFEKSLGYIAKEIAKPENISKTYFFGNTAFAPIENNMVDMILSKPVDSASAKHVEISCDDLNKRGPEEIIYNQALCYMANNVGKHGELPVSQFPVPGDPNESCFVELHDMITECYPQMSAINGKEAQMLYSFLSNGTLSQDMQPGYQYYTYAYYNGYFARYDEQRQSVTVFKVEDNKMYVQASGVETKDDVYSAIQQACELLNNKDRKEATPLDYAKPYEEGKTVEPGQTNEETVKVNEKDNKGEEEFEHDQFNEGEPNQDEDLMEEIGH